MIPAKLQKHKQEANGNAIRSLVIKHLDKIQHLKCYWVSSSVVCFKADQSGLISFQDIPRVGSIPCHYMIMIRREGKTYHNF